MSHCRLFDPDLWAVWAPEWLPGPTLDMRTPCWCSARLCGWQESTAAFTGRAAGPGEPPVNPSYLMFSYRDATREQSAVSLNWNVNPLRQTTAVAHSTRSIPATCSNTQRAELFPWKRSEFELRDRLKLTSRPQRESSFSATYVLSTCYKEQLSTQKKTSMCLSTCEYDCYAVVYGNKADCT